MSTPPSGLGGFGMGGWGDSPWGGGFVPPPGPPVITPLDPIDNQTDVSQSHPIFIRLTDDDGINPATLRITVGPTIYVLGGVAQNGATLFTQDNDGNGFDVDLRVPVVFPLGSIQEVTVSISDTDGEISELIYRFHVGVGLRLLQVRNPSPNNLVAYFNRPLRQDDSLRFVPNWVIGLVSEGAKPLDITEVLTNQVHANLVTLHYVGGGSVYSLTVYGVADVDGNPIDPDYNTALFDLVYGDEPSPSIRLFDTIYGPIGVSQRIRTRRTMDDHTVSRSIALGMDEQFRLRFNNLDGSAGRDGRPGKNRT